MAELDAPTGDVGPEARELARTLRMLLDSLGISLRRYAGRTYSDAGTVSRYVNGKRVPPWSFVEGLLAQVAEHRGEPITAEAMGRLRSLHRAAVAAGTSNRRVQELQLLLEEQDQEVRESQAREQVLSEALHDRQHRLHTVQTHLRALEAARAADREEHRTALDQARTEQARLQTERDSLLREVTSLRRQLLQARQTTFLAEERCAHLERQLDAAEHKYAQAPRPRTPGRQPAPAPGTALPTLPGQAPPPSSAGAPPPGKNQATVGPGPARYSAVPATAPSGPRRTGTTVSDRLPGDSTPDRPEEPHPTTSRATAAPARRRLLLTGLATVTALATVGDMPQQTSHQTPSPKTRRGVHSLATKLAAMGDITTAAVSTDGRLIATGGEDGTTRLWDTITGERLGYLLHGRSVTAVAVSVQGRIVATGSEDGTARLWEFATGELLGTPVHSSGITAMALSPDGTTLVTGDQDGQCRLWGAATGEQIGTLPRASGAVYVAVFSPNGKTFATSGDETVQLWETATRREIGSLPTNRFADIGAGVRSGFTASSAAFSRDGKTLATSGGETVRLWNTTTLKHVGTVPISQGPTISSLSFSPDGKMLATASRTEGVWLWNLTARSRALRDMTARWGVQPLAHHTGSIEALAFAPASRQLITVSGKGQMLRWPS